MGFIITAALQVPEVGIILGKQDWTNIMKEDTFRLHHICAQSLTHVPLTGWKALTSLAPPPEDSAKKIGLTPVLPLSLLA